MKVTTWNMASNTGLPSGHSSRWDYLFSLDSDIAFVQEARPPRDGLPNGFKISWAPAFKHGWGSGIVTKACVAEPIDFTLWRWLSRYWGWVLVGGCEFGNRGLMVASIHASWRQVDSSEIADLDLADFPLQGRKGTWPLYLIFDDLARLLANRCFIVGGDLNADVAMDAIPHFAGGNRDFFDSLERRGLYELGADEAAPTHRGYREDYIFVDMQTARREYTFSVDSLPVQEGLSDHSSVIAEFAEP
jgi:hypothetical protein